jgi:hypothetical protein
MLVQLITTEWTGAILFHIAREEEFLSDRINELPEEVGSTFFRNFGVNQ